MTLEDLFNNGEEISSLPNPIDYYFYRGLKEGYVILNDDIEDDIVERVIFPLR